MIRSLVLRKLNLRRSTFLLAVAYFVLATPAIHTQTTASPSATGKPVEWDAVTIKPSDPASNVLSHSTGRSNGYSVTTPLRQFIGDAYGIRQDLITGLPKWAESARYDIEARVAGADVAQFRAMTPSQGGLMLQSILADRFKLKAHIETKPLSIYNLVVTKPGKLHEVEPGPGGSSWGPGQIKCRSCDLAVVVNALSQNLQRTVVDNTGLNGKYNIELLWSDSNGPSLFTALEEQLGLKLDSTKGPVKTLVVEHVEPPSQN